MQLEERLFGLFKNSEPHKQAFTTQAERSLCQFYFIFIFCKFKKISLISINIKINNINDY